jgi:AcrR family transcriptional regulator
MTDSDWTETYRRILQLEKRGLVSRTFRRLDPERQQAVISAILAEATETGPADLNIKRVAERAGVAIGSLYQYFGSRAGLMDFAVALVVQSVVDSLNFYRPYLAAMPLPEAIMAYLQGGLEWNEQQAGFIRFFARAAYQGNPELAESVVRPIATALREMVRDILTQAAARGEIRAEVDVEAAARVVNALIIAIADPVMLPYLNTYFQVTDDTIPPERIFATMLALVLRGLSPPESASS